MEDSGFQPTRFDAYFLVGGEAEFGHFEEIQKTTRVNIISGGQFGRKSSHKSSNFSRSRPWCSRNFFVPVPCLWCAKNPTFTRELTFNSRLGNSRQHIVHGNCTRSTNSVSSTLPQLAKVALLARFAAYCAFGRMKAHHKAWACPKPSAV